MYEHSKIINSLIVNSYLPYRDYEAYKLLSSFLFLVIKITMNCVNMVFSEINLIEYIFICLLYLQLHEVKTNMEGYRSNYNQDHIQWRLVSKGTEGSQLQGGPGTFPRDLGGGPKQGLPQKMLKIFYFKPAFLNHFVT